LAGFALQAQPPAPRHSPEFVLNFNDGSTKLLSSYRGKAVAVEFLHTTCPHCQHASQVFSKLYTEYGAKGFQPIGVAWNDMAKMLVPDFIKSFTVNYPVAYADRDKVLDYLGISPMMRSVVPQIVWIDKTGTIRSQTPAGGEESMLQEKYWREMIEMLTSDAKAPAPKGKVPPTKKPTT
jgi:peroxiredoxin